MHVKLPEDAVLIIELCSSGEGVRSDAERHEGFINDSAKSDVREETLPPLTPLSHSEKKLEEAMLAPGTPERAQMPVTPTTPTPAEPANIVPVSLQANALMLLASLAELPRMAGISQPGSEHPHRPRFGLGHPLCR